MSETPEKSGTEGDRLLTWLVYGAILALLLIAFFAPPDVSEPAAPPRRTTTTLNTHERLAVDCKPDSKDPECGRTVLV